MRYVLLLLAVLLGSPLAAATLNIGGAPAAGGTSIALNLGDFTRLGICGSGGSVRSDGCAPVIGDSLQAASGRYAVAPSASWVDSQDTPALGWHVALPKGSRAFSFAVTDLGDQPQTDHFNVSSGGSTATIAGGQANGSLYWFTLALDKGQRSADILFTSIAKAGRTPQNDGFGITGAQVAPVPLPPAVGLLMLGAGLLGSLRLRRRRC